MNMTKERILFKVVSMVVIVSFITLDVSRACPYEPAECNNVAAQSVFQQQMMLEYAQKFRESLFFDANILGSVLSIAGYLLGDAEKNINPLPMEHLEAVMKNELGEALAGIELSKVVDRDGVVLIPFVKDDKRNIIQMALKNNLSAQDLAGYEWVISDKYAVKVLSEDYKEPASEQAIAEEEPEVTLSEPIAEVSVDKITAPETVSEKKQIFEFQIRAIIKTVESTVLMFLLGGCAYLPHNDKIKGVLVMATFIALISSPSWIPRVISLVWRKVSPVGWYSSALNAGWVNRHWENIGKEDAIRTLVKLGGKRAIKSLLKALSKDVYENVEEALKKLGATKEQMFDGYIMVLSSGLVSARQNAIKALGEFGDKRAIEPLLKTLSDAEYENAEEALKKLGASKEQMVDGYIAALSGGYGKNNAVKALGELGDRRAIKPLMEAWSTCEAFEDVREALKKLGASKEQVVDKCIAALSSWDNSTIRYAIKALGELGDRRAIKPLLEGWPNYDHGIFENINEAANLLGASKEQMFDMYISALSNSETPTVGNVIKALGELGDRRAIKPLLEGWSTYDQGIFENINEAFKKLGASKEQIFDMYISALSNSNTPTIKNVIKALGELGDNRAIKPLLEKLSDENMCKNAEEALKKLGATKEQMVDGYIAALSRGRGDTKQNAGKALEELGDERAIEPLLEKLSDENMCKNAEEALKKLGATKEQMVDGYIAALASPYIFTISNAVEALGELGDKRAIEPLLKELASCSHSYREAEGLRHATQYKYLYEYAEESLEKLGASKEQMVDRYIAVLLRKGAAAKENAAKALGNLGYKRAIEPLLEQLSDKYMYKVAEEALKKLGASKEQILDGYIAALSSNACIKAAEALGNLGDKRAVEPLLKQLSKTDIEYGVVVSDALEKINAPGSAWLYFEHWLRKYIFKEVGGYDGWKNIHWKNNVNMKKIIKVFTPLIRLKGNMKDDRRITSSIAEINVILRQVITKTYYPAQTGTYEGGYEEEQRYSNRWISTGEVTVTTKDAYYEINCDFKKLKKLIREREELSKERQMEREREEVAKQRQIEKEAVSTEQIPAAVTQTSQDIETPADDKVKELFELVEATINNRRAGLVKAGNEVLVFLAEQSGRPFGEPEIESAESSVEIGKRINELLDDWDSMDIKPDSAEEKGIPKNILSAVTYLRENSGRIETDSIIAGVITLARQAGREGQNLIIGLETGWIPGYEKGTMQHNALNPLVKEIESLGKTLRSLGLENVTVIHADGEKLAGNILEEAERTSTGLSNVVVLASKDTVNSAMFDQIKSTEKEKRAFLAVVDPAELIKEKSSDAQVTIVQIVEMLSIALELATGKDAPDLPLIVEYDEDLRVVVFLPKIEPVDYEKLKEHYNMRKLALQSA
ncbi:MAG: hypothetical protein ABID83_04545 [Candidatus Omnitrophota bacterium]